VKSSFTKHTKGEDVAPYEYKLTTREGRIIDAILTAKLITYEGEPAILGTVIDITERKKAERELFDKQMKLQNIFAASPDAITVTDLNGDIIDCNQAALNLYGCLSKDDLIGKSAFDLIAKKDQPRAIEKMKETIEQGLVKDVLYTLVAKDGREYPAELSSSVVKDSSGNAVAFMAIIRDITERKKTEKLVHESQGKFEGLFMDNPEAAVYLGPDFHILDINPCFEKLFEYNLAEIKGKHINEVVVPKDKMEEAEILDRKVAEGYVYLDTVRRGKDGSLVPVAVSAAPIMVEGRPVGYVGMYKDISELRNAGRKLEMLNEKLRVVGGLTRHDVRNKLSTITGNIFLNKKRLAGHPETLESFSDMESVCEQIVRIFDFAKDYELLGAEELKYVDVEKFVDEAVSLFPNLQGVKISNGCHGLTVLADSLLRQLFCNLIDNSLKYGEKLSQIRIHYEKAEENQLRLIYEDDGVGIASNAKQKIFDGGYTTGKGSGYGLYLVKRMMEVYSWTIQETGTPGKGAQFTITIPKTNQNGKENYLIA
jgi:PAS domain S-box-containing protein